VAFDAAPQGRAALSGAYAYLARAPALAAATCSASTVCTPPALDCAPARARRAETPPRRGRGCRRADVGCSCSSAFIFASSSTEIACTRQDFLVPFLRSPRRGRCGRCATRACCGRRSTTARLSCSAASPRATLVDPLRPTAAHARGGPLKSRRRGGRADALAAGQRAEEASRDVQLDQHAAALAHALAFLVDNFFAGAAAPGAPPVLAKLAALFALDRLEAS
jgi:hypothetical protein